MKDAYEVLELTTDADEAAVRQRYLELVRQFPPDQSPERFAEIRAAYDALSDPARRLEQQIFGARSHDSLEDIIAAVRGRLRNARIPVETLLSLGDS